VRDVSFDLVIVDEAHKMAAYTQGKKVRKTKRGGRVAKKLAQMIEQEAEAYENHS